MIPSITRTKGGIRDYTEQDIQDIGWVENAICMRNAGLSVETLAEYVRLFQEGDSTIPARRALLAKERGFCFIGNEVSYKINKAGADLFLSYKFAPVL